MSRINNVGIQIGSLFEKTTFQSPKCLTCNVGGRVHRVAAREGGCYKINTMYTSSRKIPSEFGQFPPSDFTLAAPKPFLTQISAQSPLL